MNSQQYAQTATVWIFCLLRLNVENVSHYWFYTLVNKVLHTCSASVYDFNWKRMCTKKTTGTKTLIRLACLLPRLFVSRVLYGCQKLPRHTQPGLQAHQGYLHTPLGKPLWTCACLFFLLLFFLKTLSLFGIPHTARSRLLLDVSVASFESKETKKKKNRTGSGVSIYIWTWVSKQRHVSLQVSFAYLSWFCNARP